MSSSRTPCRRCGGDKGPPAHKRDNSRYCPPCQIEHRRDTWRKVHPWYCGSCDSPYYCVTCARIKRDRQAARWANQRGKPKTSKNSNYFRPLDAEGWWQRRSHALVNQAVKRGLIPDLKSGDYACTDCGGVAHVYEHRDYGRPFDVDPVCHSCNGLRGTAVWPDASRFEFRKLPVTRHAR